MNILIQNIGESITKNILVKLQSNTEHIVVKEYYEGDNCNLFTLGDIYPQRIKDIQSKSIGDKAFMVANGKVFLLEISSGAQNNLPLTLYLYDQFGNYWENQFYLEIL